MFHQLVNHNDDLRRLVEKGYAVAIDGGYLVIRDIPYLDSQNQLQWGAFVAKLGTSAPARITRVRCTRGAAARCSLVEPGPGGGAQADASASMSRKSPRCTTRFFKLPSLADRSCYSENRSPCHPETAHLSLSKGEREVAQPRAHGSTGSTMSGRITKAYG